MPLENLLEHSLNPFSKEVRNPMRCKGGKINTPEEERFENLKVNIRLGLPQLQPHFPNKIPVAICAGGPSLETELPRLRELIAEGVKVVACNNTHEWLQENGITPSAMVLLDSRQFNVRFVANPVRTCKYLISNQCHPDVFAALSDYDTYIWHTNPSGESKKELDTFYNKHYHGVVGGSTIGLRAIVVMRMLGYQFFHVFGLDSCMVDGEHHPYKQPENDNAKIHEVYCCGKKFYCAGWQIKQYEDFLGLFRFVGEYFHLEIYGDGIPAHFLKSLAKPSFRRKLWLLDKVDKLLGRDLRKKYLLDTPSEETSASSSIENSEEVPKVVDLPFFARKEM